MSTQAFKRVTSRAVGTSATKIGAYTVSATSSTVIGLCISNTVGNAAVSVNIYHSDGTNNTYLVYQAPIPAGGALVVIGNEQKVVLQAGDSIYAQVVGSGTVDVLMSALELS